jgi:serine/threonine-protein kinase
VIVLAAGQHIGDRYQLERRIAVGGMGEVWEASDARLGRSVAVKILRPELSGDPEFLHRFRIEARTVASLDHHGIAAVHDYGESEGPGGRATAYLVMELVRGEPLSTHIARGPIAPDETLRLLEEAAWALHAAHERGYVHRDVKPGNILVRIDGTVKLTDFGIAKAADAVPVTRSGMVMGTAHYIAPEQASGAEAGPAGDVYSLGIVGYECLVGHRPFRAESAVAVAMMQVRDEPPPLPDTIPGPVRQLVLATLVKDPTQRYATGGEFAEAVAAVRRGELVPVPASISGATPIVSPPAPPIRGRSTAVATPPPAPAVPAEITRAGADRSSSPIPTPAPPSRPPPPPAPIVPLRLQPVARTGRTVLVVLFVLLTLAALALGVLILRGGVSGLGELNLGGMHLGERALRSAATGSVAGWEGVVAGWMVVGRALIPRYREEGSPVNPSSRRSGARGRAAALPGAPPPGKMTTTPDTLGNPQR